MTETFKPRLQLSNDSIQTSDSSTTSSPRIASPTSKESDQNCIKEVYDFNYLEELNVISELLDEYNYIGMDTEFPGCVYNVDVITNDFYYKTLKMNVDSLKLIQLGITLTNEHGEYPKNIPYHTWQFNFKFDIKKDEFNENSIKLLKKSGIDFDKLKKDGIKKNQFASALMTSGLVLNPDVYWISYHGSYDFGYLLSILTNETLPKDEEEFIKTLSIYFPNFYDIKMIIKDLDYLDGGLNRLINKIGVKRKGIMHQAGSDSIATVESFLSLINLHLINDAKIFSSRNSLYGIGKGRDNENTINYTSINKNKNNNNNSILNKKNSNHNINININNNCDENKDRNNCAFDMKQSKNNNFSNFNSNNNNCCLNNNNSAKFNNWFCPFLFFGNYGMMQNNNNCNSNNNYMNQINNNNFMMSNINEIMA